jgi:hypothetical protein
MSCGTFDAHVGRKAVWGGWLLRIGCALSVVTFSACGDVVRQGTGSSYLIVNALEGASGATPNAFGTILSSDVVTVVDQVPTVFADNGRVTFTLAMKDPTSGVNPTPANFITIDRYNVRYFRADGRNTPGVDVPYPFDGAITVTITGGGSAGFTLVRLAAKAEAPLAALARNFTVISTIAEVTFFGRDGTGREVTVSARMGVDFGNFGDPN